MKNLNIAGLVIALLVFFIIPSSLGRLVQFLPALAIIVMLRNLLKDSAKAPAVRKAEVVVAVTPGEPLLSVDSVSSDKLPFWIPIVAMAVAASALIKAFAKE